MNNGLEGVVAADTVLSHADGESGAVWVRGYTIEKLAADKGASVEFNQVLLVGAGSSVTLGAPYVETAKVTATVESHGKGDKVRIVKFRRRKHYKREKTHRQPYTDVKITSIVA